MPASERIHTLIANFEGAEIAYQYMCREGDTVPPLATFRKPISIQELKELAEPLARALEICARRPTSQAGAAFREFGGRLYERIIPGELAQKLRTDPSASYLVLYLDPALVWLPWEILWDGERFWGWRFRVARLLQKAGGELRAAEQRLREVRSGRGALVVFGNVTGLDAAGERAEVEKALGAVYGKNVWFHRAKGAADVLEQLTQDYEVCHFVGHGRYVEQAPGESGWTFADGTVLTCKNIESVSLRAAFPLLIFANSCDSAHASFVESAGYVSTLYRAFLRQGVPHYIGTATPVPDAPSKEFARSFYRLLAEGLSVGEALGEAKRIFFERPGTPIWASYIHYGDPTYHLVPASNTRASGSETPWSAAWQEILQQKTSFSVLGRLSKEEVHRMLDHYRSATAANPADGEAHFALALCYLQLGLHDLALKNFKRTVELMPEYADAYYYYGLSLVRGRRPKTLTLNEVRLIEQHLETALQLNGREAKYYYLAAILKFDYYLSNGLAVRPPTSGELFEMAEGKEHDPWEVERLLQAVPLRDSELLSRIRRTHQTSTI
jgi:tetratricopeptide (TPR) repeat protein